MELGRYRLLTEQDFERNPRLRELRDLVDQSDDESAEVSGVRLESAETASLNARLLPTLLSPKGPPGWRLSIPAELPPEGTGDEGATLYLLLSKGGLELWSKDRFEQLLKVPITKLYKGI
jgi:hypothetical protein